MAVALPLAALALAGAVQGKQVLGPSRLLCTEPCHGESLSRGTAHPGHQNLACGACHQSSSAAAVELAWQAAVDPDGKVPAHGGLDRESCGRCHNAEDDPTWRLAAATQGHRAHQSGPGTASCLDCHARGEHRAEPAAARCDDCHEPERIHAEPIADAPEGTDPDSCVACHGFASGLRRAAPSSVQSCGPCHAQPTGKATRAVAQPDTLHGLLDCKLCHNPHGHDRSLEQGGHRCESCHQIEMTWERLPPAGARLTGSDEPRGIVPIAATEDALEDVPEGHRGCEGCHPPHGPLELADDACRDCHDDYAPEVESLPAPSTAARHEACSDCHEPHRWRAGRSGCGQAECHEDVESELLLHSAPEHANCNDCHLPHEPLPTVATCFRCHPGQAGPLGTAPSAHADCTACHSPHSTRSAPQVSCGGCHGTAAQQLVHNASPSHRALGCAGCHSSHGNPTMAADGCSSCHADESAQAKAAKSAEHQQCSSCHPPHGFQVAGEEQSCAGCHPEQSADETVHAGSCAECHASHGAAAVSEEACQSCHEEIQLVAKEGGRHARCATCHPGHQDASAANASCGTCHAYAVRTRAKWPAGSPHQDDCSSCHQAHNTTAHQSCESCHDEHTHTPEGDPHSCADCHAAHLAPPAGGAKGWWSRCALCHSDEATATAGYGPTHAKCASCHGVHTAPSTSCVSCHVDEARRAAHATPEHQRCSDCHDAHARGAVPPARCLACHDDLGEHYPSSAQCQSCHPF